MVYHLRINLNYCSKCGNELLEDEEVCNSCGNSIHENVLINQKVTEKPKEIGSYDTIGGLLVLVVLGKIADIIQAPHRIWTYINILWKAEVFEKQIIPVIFTNIACNNCISF